MRISNLIIFTFIVTGLYDVILGQLSKNFEKLPSFFNWFPFIKYLRPYFEHHTILAAALIAGFIGAVTQFIIVNIYSFPTTLKLSTLFSFLFISVIISALFGFVMKATTLFPYLDKYYYKKLGLVRSIIHDGVSGLIVQITLLFLINIIDYV